MIDVTDPANVEEIYSNEDLKHRGMTVSNVNGIDYLFLLDTSIFSYLEMPCSQTVCAFEILADGIDLSLENVKGFTGLPGHVIGDIPLSV